jgi:hypothetical protein
MAHMEEDSGENLHPFIQGLLGTLPEPSVRDPSGKGRETVMVSVFV